MTQKSCTVEMRNAILRNYLKANLAEIWPKNHQNVQETPFSQKAPGALGFSRGERRMNQPLLQQRIVRQILPNLILFAAPNLMHLSMFSPRVGGQATHGKLTQQAFPWVGILTVERCPWVGNLTWPPSWKTERTWK